MKYLVYLSFFIGFILSCKSASNDMEKKMIEDNTQLLKDLMVLWETGDTLNTNKIFLENCEYTDVANNNTLSGIKGVNRYITHVHKWASNVQMTIRKVNVAEELGYVEWTFTAVQSNPIEGRVPIATNKDITLNGVTLVEIKSGKIQNASDYMDILGFVIQLGSKIELPGGVKIGE